MALLLYLAERAGQIVTYAEIERDLAETTLELSSAGKRIHRLRYALGDRDRTLIRSVRNRGYMIER